MNRRGFLSLMLATPLIPALAKLESVIQAPVIEAPPEPFAAGEFHLQRYVMSFGDGQLVRPGGVVRYAASLQRLFRPERIMIAPASGKFGLLGLSAGGEPNLAEEISAEVFDPRAFGVNLHFAPVRVGDEIILCAVNRGAEPAPFHLALLGSAVVEGPPPSLGVWMPGDDDDEEIDDEDDDA